MPSALAQLGRDLNFHTDNDSAAILTVLLEHYRTATRENGHIKLSELLQDDISAPDIVCHLALNTATDWVSSSQARADSFVQYDAFTRQMSEWNSKFVKSGDAQLFPYESGLQLLLRLCMNSANAAQVRPAQRLRSP